MTLAIIGATPAAAVSASSLSYSGDVRTPNPYIEADVTKAAHQVGWDATTYEADNGSKATLPATVNDSVDNPYAYAATDINDSDFGAFPRKGEDGNSASALDASEWSTTDTTTSDVTTAPGVNAVEVATNGSMGSGDVASSVYQNFSITSDAEKRFVQLGLTVDSLESGTLVEVRFVDSDGDYVTANISSSATASNEDIIANATGDGYFYQRQVGKMSVYGSGDGTMQEIQKIKVVFTGGDANIDLMAVNGEKMSKYVLGEKKEDTDGDDALETTTIHEVYTAGSISVHSLDTIGSTFDDATLHDLTIDMKFRAQDLSATDGDVTDVKAQMESADEYPSYAKILNVSYRLELPDAYDLSYANAELRMEQEWPGGRYVVVEYAEGVGTTDFENISSWTDSTGSFGTQGNEVVLDSTVSAGTQFAVHVDILLTSAEADAIASAGGAAPMDGGGGGFWDMVFSLPGAIVAAVGAFWFRNKIPVLRRFA